MINMYFLRVIFVVTFLFVSSSISQTRQQYIFYLKDGNIVKVVGLEELPKNKIRVQTIDGSIIVYNVSEIQRIEKLDNSSVSGVGKKQVRVGGAYFIGGAVGVLMYNEIFFEGLNLNYKYDISDQIRVGANIGYYSDLTSVTGLFEYSFSDNDFSPYSGIDVGIYLDEYGSYFGLAPVVGFNYSLSDNLLLNSNLRYNHIFTISSGSITFNAGLSYKF